MAERSTIYEVARRSAVSTATVSRVMRNGTGFSPATRERVLAAAVELGWVPSGSARGLANRRAGIVGLVFPDLSSGSEAEEESPLYVDQVIRGAEKAATEVGDAVLIAASRGSSGRDLAFSIASKVDGLVVVAHSLPESDIAAIARSLPVVALSDREGRRANVDSVGVDNRGGIRAIVEHLVHTHGYRRLAFIGGPRRSPDSAERFAGYREALRRAGLPVAGTPDAVGDFTEAGGARAVGLLVTERRRPEAIVCGNDEMAVGAVGVLTSMRLRVPADIAVTGFDNLAIAKHLRPPLTTVSQPMREIGSEAVRAVLARAADHGAPRRAVVLPTRLVLRRSCGCRTKTTTSSAGRTTP